MNTTTTSLIADDLSVSEVGAIEAAWLATQADRTSGRAKKMTAAAHIADMQQRVRTSQAKN